MSTGKTVWAVVVVTILVGAAFDLGIRVGAADTISSNPVITTTLADLTPYWRECHYFTFRGPSTRRIPAQRGGPLPACPLLPP